MKKFPRARPERGAILIVALLLAAIIGVSLVSYVNLGRNNLKQAQRTYLGVAAMNLAEAGLESALYSFNQLDNATGPTAWTSWNTNVTYNTTSPFPVTAWRTIVSGFDAGQNATGTVKAFVEYPNGTRADGSTAGISPSVLVKATITPDTGAPIERYIRITLRRRGLFSNGLVARNDINWVGHPSADSWNSDPDGDGVHVAYPGVGQTANVVVASISGNITLAGGEVWGYAKTGVTGTISGGSVHGLGTTTDDPTRRTNDFDSTFPMPSAPSPTTVNTITSNVTSSRTFPNTATDSVNTADGKYYYRFSGANIVIAGSDTISIKAGEDVVFLLTSHSGATAIKSTGSAGFDINAGGTLNVYTDGNISIAGNGFANDNHNAASAIFWGTNTSTQTIDISGNGTLTGIVYAPNATASMNGGGTSGMMQGAVVANTITMNGGTEFHYDDALANLVVGNIWGISGWRELASNAERNLSTTTPTGTTTTYSALLNF